MNCMDYVFNESTSADSFRKFPELARKIFRPASIDTAVNFPIIKYASWIRCLMGFLADGQYDGNNLDNILKQVLGSDRRLFDSGTTPCTGSRVAIITSRISDGRACVLANYRGMGHRATESAYRFLNPRSPKENPFLWEVCVHTF
jgi:hypothetical protein